MMTTTSLLLTLVTCADVPAMPPLPPAPVYPRPTGDSGYAVIARPISIKAFEDHGTRYWRARYEVLVASRHQKVGNIVVEWSCDPRGDGDDPCGSLVDRVLPGFAPNDTGLVQLELRYHNASTFDGVELHYASRDGSFRLPPLNPMPLYLDEGIKAPG